MRRLLGGHKASQQFVEGFTGLHTAGAQHPPESHCWKLEASLSRADSSLSSLTYEVPY